jgi:two-component system chemotaxis response regulator CheY
MAQILAIDDDPAVTNLLRISLEAAGHEVLVANDGLLGFALAQRHHPDLILLDMLMTVTSGSAVLRALGDDPRTEGTPVVVLSALSEEEVADMPQDPKIAAYVRKPFDASILVELAAQLAAA